MNDILLVKAFHDHSAKLDEMVTTRLTDKVGSFADGQYLYYGTLADFVVDWNDKFMFFPDKGSGTIYITQHNSFSQR